MAYTVFARKYRPQSFADVVGQGAVARTLQNAVRQERVAHAYLFAGPRGVGKTSMARILAKALNCQGLKDGEPCDACDPCRTITTGRNLDVDEFDAASNRKVEDAERLLERVRQPRPVRQDSRHRVFIVDEVHMMTTHAFNALLKTLEEPPAHVNFIFATTEPEKVPETILSRCQRFDFRRIGLSDIVERLAEICRREEIEAETPALELIARRARGGMRDAQSLLDQAVALAAEREGETLRLHRGRLEAALGMAPRERVLGLLRAVVAGDIHAVLASIHEGYLEGLDAAELCAQTGRAARDCLAITTAPNAEAAAALVGDPGWAADLDPLARALGAERALYVLSTVVDLERRAALARDDRVLVELAFVKLARTGEVLRIGDAIRRLEILETRLAELGPGPAAAQAPAVARAPVARPVAPPAPKPPPPAPMPTPPPAAAPPGARPRPSPPGFREVAARYLDAVRSVAAEKPTLLAVLRSARPLRLEGSQLVLAFASRFERERVVAHAPVLRAIGDHLSNALGTRLALKTVVDADQGGQRRTREQVLQDPDVQTMMRHFRASTLLGFEETAPDGRTNGEDG